MDLYLAPNGNDRWSGHFPEPNPAKTDGPLATLPRVLSRGEPIFKGAFPVEQERHRIEADANLYYSTKGRPYFLLAGQKLSFKQWQAMGRDQHSIVADPGFRNIEKRDFTLARNSPAFKLGFKEIDLSGVGPRPVSKRAKQQ